MSAITLSAGVRQNLLSLQNTASLMTETQNRLATGKKVNTALDNASNFFTASALQARSNDLSSLMDAMSNGVRTLEAATNGLTSITKSLESMQSTLRQARQDKTFETGSYSIDTAAIGTASLKTLSFAGGAVGDTPVAVDINSPETSPASAGTNSFAFVPDTTSWGFFDEISIDIAVDGNAPVNVWFWDSDIQAIGDGDAVVDSIDEFTDALNIRMPALGLTGVTASNDGTNITLTSATTGAGSSVEITAVDGDVDGGFFGDPLNATFGATVGAGTPGSDGSADDFVKTVDQLVSDINSNAGLKGKIRASNNSGKLRIENQSTQELTLTGVTPSGSMDGGAGTDTIDGNTVRADLVDQFNILRDQLDKLSDDSAFNGVNLLRGDNLKITFNETGTSAINIQSKNGETINSAYLGLSDRVASDFDSDADIDGLLADVKRALDAIRSQSSSFGSNLSMVENRQNFTTAMMNTLVNGADNLTLADGNEEAANMLALQTRQQLSSTALSFASQADQAPLQLF